MNTTAQESGAIIVVRAGCRLDSGGKDECGQKNTRESKKDERRLMFGNWSTHLAESEPNEPGPHIPDQLGGVHVQKAAMGKARGHL